jgi:hypothetical protein
VIGTASAPLKSTTSLPATDRGTKMDPSDEQPANDWLSIRRSFDPISIRTSVRFLHFRKLCSLMISTEAGIKIDSSIEHLSNARPLMLRTLDGDSNSNFRSCLHFENDPTQISSMEQLIFTSESRPKYRINELPAKFVRNSPETRK